MAEPIYSTAGRTLPGHRRLMDICAVLALSLLLSVSIPALTLKVNWLAVSVGGLFFFAFSAALLTGFNRSIYWLLLINYTVSYFFPVFLSSIVVISLLFFPLLLGDKKKWPDEPRVIPNMKPLLLMLLGGAVSLIYSGFVNGGEFKYYLRYDFYFLLGLVFAYELYFLFKLKILNPEKLITYIGLSGLVVVCYIFALHLKNGSTDLIFNVRLGFNVAARENPNILAMYLDLVLPCAFFTAFFEKQKNIKKMFFYGLSLFYIVIIFMTASRGSLPGIAVIAAYAIWRKRSIKLLLGTLACTILIFSTVGVTMIQRALSPDMTDMMSGVGRIELLRSAFGMLRENHFFFGVGMENFTLMKYDYGFPLWFDTRKTMKSHNLFVDIWLGWGILGMLGWFVFNAVITGALIRKHKNCAMANAVIFSIIAFSAHGLFDSACGHTAIMCTYFALLGIGLFLMAQTNHISDKSDKNNLSKGVDNAINPHTGDHKARHAT